MKQSPVIILGMHRSGTTMVTNLLERLGLFVGEEKEPNNEALFFVNLNTWAMQEARCAWDDPSNFPYVNDYFRENVARVLAMHLGSMKAVEFLGWKRFLNYRDIRNLDLPWGWKDPRNTFTIELWRRIFPGSKVIHIYRNPLDVAESLRVREQRKNDAIIAQGPRLKGFKLWKRERRLKRRVGYQESFRLADINENIALWEQYTRKALSLDGLLGGDLLHVRYETLLGDFTGQFLPILRHIGLDRSRADVEALEVHVKKDRKFAFTKKPELMAIYERMKGSDLMRKLGYDALQGQERDGTR